MHIVLILLFSLLMLLCLSLFCVPFVLFNAHNHLQDIDQMSRYVSPVNPAVYPHLSVTLLSIGLFFMAWFFVYPCSKLHMRIHHGNSLPFLFATWISSLRLVHWLCLNIMVDMVELVHSVLCWLLSDHFIMVTVNWTDWTRLPTGYWQWYIRWCSLTPFPRYEVTSNKFSRSLMKELLVALWASLFLGFGVLFLLLWVGIYVWQ